MATADEESDLSQALDALDDVLESVGVERVHLGVASATLLAIVARLYDLGARTAHWDEGRVGYWILQYMQTGNYEYRPIIHGPFYHHVNSFLFDALGTSDFTMRLVVAVAGGLLPLTAFLFRDRLRNAEMVALAFFLAANPVLLYYSRFMRGDPLVGAFMFTAFALFVRSIDTGRHRYFYPAVAFVGLALTVKENALIYPVTWAGATVLLLDHRLFLARDGQARWPTVLKRYVRSTGSAVRRWAVPLLLAPVELLAIVVFFYAPRAATDDGPGLWKAFGQPSMFQDVIYEGSVGAWKEFWGLWIGGGHQDHSYLPYLGDFLQTMAQGAVVLSALAVAGFLVDRYSGRRPRDVVSFAFYWGFVSILGYPIITDIKAPWATIHAIVPLTIPAAVGVGLLYRWGTDAYAERNLVDVGLVAMILLLVGGQIAVASVDAVYRNPQSGDNELVQFAQPGDDVKPLVATMVAARNETDTQVLFYGDYYVDGAEDAEREPACVKWFNSLPMPWYLEANDLNATCAESEREVRDAVATSQPPLVVVRTPKRGDIADDLPNYEPRYYSFRAWGTNSTVFVHEDYADRVPGRIPDASKSARSASDTAEPTVSGSAEPSA
ncbi:flippase activity-associated protein Agl23 [Haloarculaceae archaeon H-GB2-1]|nr:TIGR03663 family protein [Haloarculaceae archaeon H-GB1-1]MEA5408780.1 flippase activity-associated protein Agl23 [Haloarculaceae archaeon H-GB2-1]